MRIISKFKDYYDHAMGFGQDLSIVYNRVFEEEAFLLDKSFNKLAISGFQSSRLELLLKCTEKFYIRDRDLAGQWIDSANCFLILAGKLYPGLYFNNEYYFSFEKLSNLKESLIEKGFQDAWTNRRIQAILDQMSMQRYRKHSTRDEYITIPCDYFYNDCVTFNTPCLLITPGRLRASIKYNPCLKDLGFVHVLDPFECFQEIEMFMGAVKTNQLDKLPSISDKYKIVEHGFDERSFRPGSRK